jgi:hypothetical protein
MSPIPALIPLTELAHELTLLTGKKTKYRRLYDLVLNGDLPAERINGRLFVREENVPGIAEIIGLTAAA